jgi:hypothetical protein
MARVTCSSAVMVWSGGCIEVDVVLRGLSTWVGEENISFGPGG